MDINVNVKFEKEVIDFLKSITVGKAIKQESTNITNISSAAKEDKETVKQKETTKEEKNNTAQEETDKQDTPNAEQEITIDDVRKAFKAIKDKKGADFAKDLLRDLGYKKIPDIEPEKYAEIMEKVKEAA